MLKSLYSRHNRIFLHLLRANREALQVRQSDLAQLLGVGQATVSKVESGDRRLDIISLREWLLALGIDFVAFMAELDAQLGSHPIPDARLRARGRSVAKRAKGTDESLGKDCETKT